MKIDLIVGARPNFVKMAPIIDAINKSKKEGRDIHYRLVHTGQHYDRMMSGSFFEELCIPDPHVNLGCGGGSQAEQTAAIMIAYENLIIQEQPDICLVVGDVTSTMACSLVAQKANIKVAHVEAGIRSGDWSMPEEINRIVTDSITNYFFTTTELANENLRESGVSDDHIFLVGNTMIDTLVKRRPFFRKPLIWDELGLEKRKYIVLTLHRPANVDKEVEFKLLLEEIIKSSMGLPIIFPVHPRTAKIIRTLLSSNLDKASSINTLAKNLHVIDPMGYLEFNYLVEHSKAVITDSGGITEETTVMGIPCITLRDNTERPETISIGTNELIGTDPKTIKPIMAKLYAGNWKKGGIPELWDGKTAERIINILLSC